MFPKAGWKMYHGLCMFPLPHNPSKGAVGTSPAVEKAQFREFGSQVFLLQPQPPLPRISLESLNEATPSVKTRTWGQWMLIRHSYFN